MTGIDFNTITLGHFTKLEEVKFWAETGEISEPLECMQQILSCWIPQETLVKTRRLHVYSSHFLCNVPRQLNILEKYARLFERHAELGELEL